MRKVRSKIVRGALVTTLGLSALALVGVGANTLDSEVVSAQTAVYFIDGADVRIAADGTSGIRFKTHYEKTAYGELDIVSTGTLVIPADVLGTAELVVGNESAQVIDTTEVWQEEGDYMRTYAYLYDIPEASYTRDLVARSYVELNTDVEADKYVYTETYTESIYDVATDLIASGELGELEDDVAVYAKKAYDGAILDVSTAARISADTTTFGYAPEYVESYKGGENLMKMTFSEDYYYLENSAWKVNYWLNYYSDYTHLTVDFYGENLEYINEFRIDGVDAAGTQIKGALQSSSRRLSNGWNSVSLDLNKIYGNDSFADNYALYANKIRFWGSFLADYKDGANANKSYVYLAGAYASRTLTVTNSHAGGVMEGQKYVVNDNAATVFADCSDLVLTVYNDEGKFVVTNGEFTPTVVGNHLFVYTATDANGKAVRASYNVNITIAEAGLLNSFDTVSGINSSTASIRMAWVETYADKQGVVKLSRTSSGTQSHFANNQTGFMAFGADAYADYTHIVADVYVVNPNNATVSIALRNPTSSAVATEYVTLDKTGEWTQVAFKIPSNMNWSDYASKINFSTTESTGDTAVEIYIDKMYCAVIEEEIVEAEAGLVNDFTTNNGLTSNFRMDWVSSYEGKDGVLKLSRSNASGAQNVIGTMTSFLVNDPADYADYTEICFDVYVDLGSATYAKLALREPSGDQSQMSDFVSISTTGAWTTVSMTIADIEAYRTSQGKTWDWSIIQNSMQFFTDADSADCVIYIDKIYCK